MWDLEMRGGAGGGGAGRGPGCGAGRESTMWRPCTALHCTALHNPVVTSLLAPPPAQTFLKAICANWFVCLAVWQALGANSMGGKFIACLGPVSAFVCIGCAGWRAGRGGGREEGGSGEMPTLAAFSTACVCQRTLTLGASTQYRCTALQAGALHCQHVLRAAGHPVR